MFGIATQHFEEEVWVNQSARESAHKQIEDCGTNRTVFGIRFEPFETYGKTDMHAAVEVVAFLLGFIGWIMVGVALPNRYWRVSTVDGNVITTSTIYENLWMSCATDSTGVHNCRDFPSLLALSGE